MKFISTSRSISIAILYLYLYLYCISHRGMGGGGIVPYEERRVALSSSFRLTRSELDGRWHVKGAGYSGDLNSYQYSGPIFRRYM